MSFAPNVIEMLARARADLRMGVPVVLDGASPVVMFSAETLTPQRLAQIKTLSTEAVLVITAQRATTLKAPAYDGDLARIALPKIVDTSWITAIANPADDLRAPMKGPFQCQRNGDATAHRTAIKLTKSARLLPAALVVPIVAAADFATANGLTMLDLAAVQTPPWRTQSTASGDSRRTSDKCLRCWAAACVSPRRRWRRALCPRNWQTPAG